MFRYKKSIPVSYERQGYIYFTSLLYWELPKRTQEKILNLCIAAGKENYQALFGTTSPPLRWNAPCGDTTRRSHGRFDMQATGAHSGRLRPLLIYDQNPVRVTPAAAGAPVRFW